MPEPIQNWLLTEHALLSMSRRGISESVVAEVLTSPEQRDAVRPGRDVLQRRVTMDGAVQLVRVIVDVDRLPAEVVTVYRTSRVAKYWRSQS